jgi:asparagine synthetase B (glutamine-hydrolysing)
MCGILGIINVTNHQPIDSSLLVKMAATMAHRGPDGAGVQIDSFDVVAPYYKRIADECPEASFLQRITFVELQLRLPELLLMRADKMAMANSVEIRVPFLDRDLMGFAMRVPDAFKLRDGVSKEPIKRLAARCVSRNDIYRPKTGFGGRSSSGSRGCWVMRWWICSLPTAALLEPAIV